MKKSFTVTGMTCAACQANVEKTVRKLNGIITADVNLITGKMNVEYDENILTDLQIINTVNSIGYKAYNDSELNNKKTNSNINKNSESENIKSRLIFSIIFLVPLVYISAGSMWGLPLPRFAGSESNILIYGFTQFLLTIPVIFLNRKFFISGIKSFIKGVPNMDSLVATGSGASLLYGIFVLYRMIFAVSTQNTELLNKYSHSLYFESSAMILTLVTVGKYLESRSKAKTNETVKKLAELSPENASVIRNGKEMTIPTEQILQGDTVIIKPGERIPADGTVVSGKGYVDQSTITGESIPVEKNEGDTVISATVNKNGSFNFIATKTGSNTTLAQIIKMVEDAGNSKAPSARLADKISGYFVPVVMVIAVITAAAWMIAGKDFEFALNCAVCVLVISCPCALGLATPVAIMTGTGKAADSGILIKNAESLEKLHLTDTVVLDKTGTVTSGKPAVTDVIPFGISEDLLIQLAASIENKSEHPLGAAIIDKAKEKNISLLYADKFESVSGKGIKAVINDSICICGNELFIKENGIEIQHRKKIENLALSGKTPLIFAKDEKICGIIAVADTVKKESVFAVDKLKKSGIHVILMTGDNRLSAQAVGRELGLKEEDIISQVLPSDKKNHIMRLQKEGKKVAMIGDGINDSPALTQADVGIAIGKGTDIAIESADIVLMKNSLTDAYNAVLLSKKVMKIIKTNLFWAFFYNTLGIPVAAGVFYPVFGLLLSPMIGSAAMSLSSLCVVSNALRLRRFQAEKAINKGEDGMKKTLKIDGMMCEHCKARVIKALSETDGVKSVDVNLESKIAEITLEKDVSDEVLIQAVTNAGYTVL